MATLITKSFIKESWKQFNCVLTQVLGLEQDHLIMLALREDLISTFNGLHLLSAQEIDTLIYRTYVEINGDSTEIINQLVKGHKGWIEALLAFMRYHNIDSNKDVENISVHEFNKFLMGTYNPWGQSNLHIIN